MKNKRKQLFFLFPLLFFLIGIFSAQKLKAQGCSDAGFCTMGAMRPNQDFGKASKVFRNSLQTSWSMEQPIPEILMNTFELELVVAVSERSGY